MKNSRNLCWITIGVLCLSSPAADADALPREHVGDRLFVTEAFLGQDGEITLHTLSNIRFGHGQGDDFTLWRRSAGDDNWERSPLPFPEDHRPGMISTLTLDDDSTLYLYVDRAGREHLYLQRVSGDGTLRTLFDLPRGGEFRRFLNPRMDRMRDGRVHLLLPDRAGSEVRRFIVDPDTAAHERLPDIRMPRRGARIYDRYQVGSRLIVPVSVSGELLFLDIDLDAHAVRSQSLDRFSHDEPPRNTSIFALEDTDEVVLFYLRPASFSSRGRTGLLGEFVCAVVDAETFDVRSSNVIAGFEAEAAATHNHDVIQVGPREFLFAHTEVDRVHERHRSGRYENYVGTFVTRWKIDEQAHPTELGRRELPFISFMTLAYGEGRQAILLGNDAREGDPLFLYRFELTEGGLSIQDD